MEIFCVSRCSLSLSISLSLCLSLSLLLLDSIFQHWGLGCAAEEAWLCKVLSWLTWLSRDFYPVWSNAMQPQLRYFLVRGGHTHTQRICSHNVFSWPKMIRWHDITFHVHSMYHIISGKRLYRGSLLMAPQQTWKNLGHRPLWPGSKCTARWDMMGLTCQIGFKLFPKSGCNTAQNHTNGTNWVSIGYHEPCTILTCISSMSWFCDNLAISSWLQVERARCQGINRHTRKHIWNNWTDSVLEL